MNILILAAGPGIKNTQNSGDYPIYLSELQGKTVLEQVISSYSKLGDVNFIFSFREDDIKHFYVDDITRIIAPGSQIVSVGENTAGAACTALLASEYIDSAEELLIIGSNEILGVNPLDIISHFYEAQADAGVVVFPSVHPRYSYVRFDNDGWVIEAAEKRPISRNATAAFHWYAHGNDFVRSTKAMIRKGADVEGVFYISPALNELVLEQKKIACFHIPLNQYHPLKMDRQIQIYEASIVGQSLLPNLDSDQ
jgi:dTDP-glucose pyrophosphorylase